MHPTILAAAMGIPVVGLAYNPKFRGFFELLGRERFVMDVEEFVGNRAVSELVGLTTTALSEGRDSDAAVSLCEQSRSMLREFLQI